MNNNSNKYNTESKKKFEVSESTNELCEIYRDFDNTLSRLVGWHEKAYGCDIDAFAEKAIAASDTFRDFVLDEIREAVCQGLSLKGERVI